MKSSSGVHYIALDHIRALAALMVFTWHFTHYTDGFPVPFEFVPAVFPLALLDEGHTGVALFMTLSGYLFAKLLDGKQIRYGAFLWNRALRLLPLLTVVTVTIGALIWLGGGDAGPHFLAAARGLWAPTLPNGGWSITIEFHFYLLLPVFLWLAARSRWLPLALVLAAIALRFFLHLERGEVQIPAYWTLVGRVDQFTLGMLAYSFRRELAGRHLVALGVLTAFVLFYWYFDRMGGWARMPSYPSPSRWWIVLPTIEGFAYAVGVAWYDSSFRPSTRGFSAFVGRIGEYSYSIYLLHFFFVFGGARFVNKYVMDITNFYVACLWALGLFVLMVIPGYLSYRFIEAPFLKLRRSYFVPVSPATHQPPAPA